MPASRWIIECEWYHVHHDIYPVEITLLSVNNPSDANNCCTYYIHYPYNYYNNLTTRYQYSRHGIRWTNGDETLYQVMYKLGKRILAGDIVYVKGLEKCKVVQNWLTQGVKVVEILNAPSLKSIPGCIDKSCDIHKQHLDLSCSQRKAYKLLSYV